MSTVLRFTHTSGNTDFDHEEVAELKVKHVQAIDLFKDLEGYHHLYKVGATYRDISIKFRLKDEDTIDNIDTIYDLVDSYLQPEIMRCYYKYSLDSTAVVYVQMIRDTMRWPYLTGHKAPGFISVRFIEATPDGVAVLTEYAAP